MSLKEKIKGNVQKVTGKMKETVGEMTDNPKLELNGKLDQLKGDAKIKAKDLKVAGEEAINDAKDSIAKKANELLDKLKEEKE